MWESILCHTLHVCIASDTQTIQSSDWPKLCCALKLNFLRFVKPNFITNATTTMLLIGQWVMDCYIRAATHQQRWQGAWRWWGCRSWSSHLSVPVSAAECPSTCPRTAQLWTEQNDTYSRMPVNLPENGPAVEEQNDTYSRMPVNLPENGPAVEEQNET